MANKELPVCPVETTLSLISNRWKVLILRDLFTGTKRFGELKKSLAGISQKVLTANLKDMEADGLLSRKGLSGGAAARGVHAYRNRRKPQALIGAMFDWGMDYKAKNNSPSNALVDALGKALH